MSYMLHFAAPGREITSIDYDEEKITMANHCFSKDDGIHFMHADILQFNFEKYDGIIMADMLHYLPEEEQHSVLQKAIHSLLPGGILVIRDGDSEKEKHGGTKLTEFFSTKVFAFNKTAATGLSFLTGSMIRKVAADNNMDCREIDETKYTSNVIFVLRKKRNDSSEI